MCRSVWGCLSMLRVTILMAHLRHAPLSEVTLDAMDVAGDQQNGIDHDIFKMRLSSDGQMLGNAMKHDLEDEDDVPALPEDYCGPCYGAGESDTVRRPVLCQMHAASCVTIECLRCRNRHAAIRAMMSRKRM